MLALNVYFDETGHGADPNTKYLGIVGCGQRVIDWDKCKDEWREVLASFGVKYFHMKEYAPSRKAFAGWRDDEPKRQKIYGDLWDIIHKVEPFVVGCFVKLEDYQSVASEFVQDSMRDAYFFCFLHCLGILSAASTDDGSVTIDQIATVFDYKPGFMDFAGSIYDQTVKRFPVYRAMIPPPIFRDMRQNWPLQVADILAYESFKELEEREKGADRRNKRWGLIQLENLLARTNDPDSREIGDEFSGIKVYSRQELTDWSNKVGNPVFKDINE